MLRFFIYVTTAVSLVGGILHLFFGKTSVEFVLEYRIEVVAAVVAAVLIFYTLDYIARAVWRRWRAGQPTAQPPTQPAQLSQPYAHRPIRTFWPVYWLALVGLGYVWYEVGSQFAGSTFAVWETTLDVGHLIWTLGALHFVAGIRIIPVDRLGGIFVLGVPTIEISGIPVLVPPLIFILLELPRGVIQMEIPAEPEKIFRAKDEDRVTQPGYKPPIRIPFAHAPDEKQDQSGIPRSDPLHQRSTNEVSFFVRLQIRRKHVFDFFVRIGNVAEARRQIEDLGVSLLVQEGTKVTFAQFLRDLDFYSNTLENTIREETESWGVLIVTARIKLPELSHGLNTSLQAISRKIAEGQGESAFLTLEGQGRANAAKADLDQRTEGMKNMAKQLNTKGGRAVLGVEAAREIGRSPSSKIIIGAPGFRELVGLGKTIADEMRDSPAGSERP